MYFENHFTGPLLRVPKLCMMFFSKMSLHDKVHTLRGLPRRDYGTRLWRRDDCYAPLLFRFNAMTLFARLHCCELST